MSTATILSRIIDVASIPSVGIERRITTSEAERAALAKAYGLREVRSLSADLIATPAARGAILVEGRVVGDIVQSCVVTLEPVEQAIDEPVEIRFAPAAAVPSAKLGAEIRIDPEAEDPPDPLLGPTLDLGAVAEEYFVLAIDPYPRAPGAAMPPGIGDEAPEEDSPFAALAALRGKPRGEG